MYYPLMAAQLLSLLLFIYTVVPLIAQPIDPCSTLQLHRKEDPSLIWRTCGYIDPVEGVLDIEKMKQSPTTNDSGTLVAPVDEYSFAAPDISNRLNIGAATLGTLGTRIAQARLQADVYSLVEDALLLHHYEVLAERKDPALNAQALVADAAAFMLERKEGKRDMVAIEAVSRAIQQVGATGAAERFTKQFGAFRASEPILDEGENALGIAGADADSTDSHSKQIANRRAQINGSDLPKLRKKRALNQLDEVAEYLTVHSPPTAQADQIMRQFRAWVSAGADPNNPRIKKIQTIINPRSGLGFAGDEAVETMPFASPAFVILLNNSSYPLDLYIDGEFYGRVDVGGRENYMVPSGPTHIAGRHPQAGSVSVQIDLGEYETYRYTVRQ